MEFEPAPFKSIKVTITNNETLQTLIQDGFLPS